MLQEKLINAIASAVYLGKSMKEFNDVNYIWHYIKGKPCKKCLVQPCCTQVCWQKIYYNTGKERLKKFTSYILQKTELTILFFYMGVVVFMFIIYIIIDVIERLGAL